MQEVPRTLVRESPVCVELLMSACVHDVSSVRFRVVHAARVAPDQHHIARFNGDVAFIRVLRLHQCRFDAIDVKIVTEPSQILTRGQGVFMYHCPAGCREDGGAA